MNDGQGEIRIGLLTRGTMKNLGAIQDGEPETILESARQGLEFQLETAYAALVPASNKVDQLGGKVGKPLRWFTEII